MTVAIPSEGIALGVNYHDPTETVCLPADPMPAHTLVVGHTGAGTDLVLAKIALHHAEAGNPTLILDPAGNIRRQLGERPAILQHDVTQDPPTIHFDISDSLPTGKALLIYADHPYGKQRPDLTPAAKHALHNLKVVMETLSCITGNTERPGLLIADQYSFAADIDWKQWTDPAHNGSIHTAIGTTRPPTNSVKRPIPDIANADAIIIRTTSRKNIAPVLDNSGIDDDLTILTDSCETGHGIGYLWLRQTGFASFFRDQPQ